MLLSLCLSHTPFRTFPGCPASEARAKVADLIMQRRYLQDVWT